MYQPIDPDHLFAANVHMRDEPRSVIEDVHDLWTQLLNMFFPFQYSAAASCRFPSEEGGVSLFVRLLPLSTLVTCGHMSGDPVDTCPAELYGDVRDNQQQQEAFPRPGGHKTGSTY